MCITCSYVNATDHVYAKSAELHCSTHDEVKKLR